MNIVDLSLGVSLDTKGVRMPRYIDADELKPDYVVGSTSTNTESYKYAVSLSQIRNAPTADVVKVKHGKWIWEGTIAYGSWVCSECGYKFRQGYGNENYCPNCGAKMWEGGAE